LLREDQSSVGAGNASYTLRNSKNGDTVRAVIGAGTVGLNTLALGVGVETGEAVADLVSIGVIAQDSVGCGTAICASVSGQGAGIAAGGASGAGETSIGVDNLEETCGTDTLTIDEGSVKGGIAGEASGG